ncbi:BREX-1 system phosphatase PglZ type B [Antarctobacter heliothermus]|uniref:PglZ domain-containing protein n=1 Tax=Antarctobacter heliothermus TaxID=74033 RepID=A0A239JYV2_9RHOB|nr:BREX-1 system phosphatase PglZ type B [Antarctobacter heliothermus]SNT10809.1 hypothetical protein SAMN04488078_105816 [Antarctobacter heliothermus]
MKVIDRLQNAVRGAAAHNPEVQVKPACILWPDPDRQWEAVVPQLQDALPEMVVLGDYAPDRRTGPAIWLRCAIAGTLDGIDFPVGSVPILYLPGVARTDLRAVNECPDALKPLAELQYRGTIWSQVSAKDWTVLAFLKSAQGGLGLEVTADGDTRAAMITALNEVLEQEVSALEGQRLDRDFFNGLLTSGDLTRDVLTWIDQGDAYTDRIGPAAWGAFSNICASQLGLDPRTAGVLTGAEKLASREGQWGTVWERFCEAPQRYPNIPDTLRKCRMPSFDLLSDISTKGAWPQWNDAEEEALRQKLLALETLTDAQARTALMGLEKAHAARRTLVWAEMGHSPLAKSLKHLAVLAAITKQSLAGGTLDDVESSYTKGGWKADDAVLSALQEANTDANAASVIAALRSIYLPWAEASARHVQKLVESEGYPGGSIASKPKTSRIDSECILFVDGLRFDLGKRLSAKLESAGLEVIETPAWSALPSVTSTAKPAVSPVLHEIEGRDQSEEFDPSVGASGQSLRGGYHFKKLITDAGYQILTRSEVGDPSGTAWTELGDIDHEGHERGWKLARHLDVLIAEVENRIVQLLEGGWTSVRIVTDHGWLIMPGGLPKTELPTALSVNKWGRCAAIKPGAKTDIPLFPWFWNSSHYFALANGIACFRSGQEYTHGGLSLQESLTLHLQVKPSLSVLATPVEISDVVWKGLRCTAVLAVPNETLTLDIRQQPANPSSTVVVKTKPFSASGSASVVVDNEDLEGTGATLVIINENGATVGQVSIAIGGVGA